MDWFVVTSASPPPEGGIPLPVEVVPERTSEGTEDGGPIFHSGCRESPQPALGTIVADAFSGTVRPRGHFAFFREHEQGLSDTP